MAMSLQDQMAFDAAMQDDTFARDVENGRAVLAAITAARAGGIELEVTDISWIDGEPYIDGMDPAEWVDAMLMD